MGEGSPFATLIIQWFGVAMLATFIYVLARAHFNESGDINLATLIVDEGIVTLAKFGGLLALLASTWVFILMALKGSLTGEIFIGYVVGWGGVKVAADFSKRPSQGSQSEEITVTKTTNKVDPPAPALAPKPDAKGYMG